MLPEPTDETKDWSASKIYSEAKSAMNEADYENAIKYYEMLESRYPFGRYAEQGQIEIAYVYYKYDEPESAIGAADRFIKLHPNHPHVDYAYYLKGLINFNRDVGFLSRLLRQDMETRDPSAATCSGSASNRSSAARKPCTSPSGKETPVSPIASRFSGMSLTRTVRP